MSFNKYYNWLMCRESLGMQAIAKFLVLTTQN